MKAEESLVVLANELIDTEKVYFNPAQLDVILVDANEYYGLMARGLGKTSGILVKRYTDCARLMPQSAGFNVQRTYQAFLTRILPSMIGGLNRLGYVRGKDYEIGRRLNKTLEPFEPPGDYGHFVHFRNGSGMHLISQDRSGSSNGLNTDWGGGDEGKYTNYEQFTEETIPTMRSNRHRFGHLHCYQQLTFLSSMPTAIDQKWMLEKEKQVQQERIDLIKQLMSARLELSAQLRSRSPNSSVSVKMVRQLQRIDEMANFYRRYGLNPDGTVDRNPTVYCSRASTLDNIAVLGEDYIRKMMLSMSEFQFRTEILNQEIIQVEGGFYPNLDIAYHTYEPSYDNGLLERFDYDLDKIADIDCRVDLDCDRDKPLIITIDWGANISCLWIAQNLPTEYRFLKTMYVKHPVLVKGLAEDFVKYYRTHRNKHVVYPYYGTETERVLNSELTYPEQFKEYLESAGFTVDLQYMGQQPTHHERYLFFQTILDKDWSGKPLRFNRFACADGLNSMYQAATRHTRKGIEKDKRSEGLKGFPQENATHFSDAWDTQIDFSFMRESFMDTPYLPHR